MAANDHEIGTVITSLKEGTTMTKYISGKKPETRTFVLKLDEFQIGLCKNNGKEESTGKFVLSLQIFKLLEFEDCLFCSPFLSLSL